MTHHACPTIGFVALTTLLAIVAGAGPPALAAPPALDDPLIHSIAPWEGQQGQPVLISGVNFGSAPEVRFNDISATILKNRPDVGLILVTVPSGNAGGAVVVTNTDTAEQSNAATFDLLPDPYPQACTLSGEVTAPSTAKLAGAVVVALDPVTEELRGAAVSVAITGAYSMSLPSIGSFDVLFLQPEETEYYQERYTVSCTGTQNHQFSTGFELTGRVVSDVSAPIENAWVGVAGTGDFGSQTLTDSNGDFFLYVPADSYEIDIVGPVGGRHVGAIGAPVNVSADTDLGDLILDTGVLVSGELRWQDDLDTGPLGGAFVADFDTDGATAGITISIADGSFYLPTETGSDLLLFVAPDTFGLQELAVYRVDVAGDMTLDYPFTIYSWAAQLPAIPTIVETEQLTVQEGRRVIFDAAQMRGTNVEIYFSDGMGGEIAGVDTIFEQDRGGIVTTVPTGADDGDVVVRVDGVDSAGYPIVVEPGVYSPGIYTTSGQVTDGSTPVANAFVGIFAFGCDDERLVDYDVTGTGGTYSVQHGAGDYALLVLPPISTELGRGEVWLLGVTGGGTQNFTLVRGNVVTARCVDSGIGIVGSTDPLPDCEIGAEGIDIDYEDSVYSDDDGNVQLNLPTGIYDAIFRSPFRSRYIDAEESTFFIGESFDSGDAPLDSGFFIEGRIVDPSGNGLVGVAITAYETIVGRNMAETWSVGADGSFRMGVPAGIYHLFPSVHPEQEYWVAPVFNLYVNQDVLLYPALEALAAGHITGTVVDGSATPIEELGVAAYEDVRGFVRQTDTCPDGSYDLKVPPGDYAIQARPSFDELCYADEYYDGHYEGCGSDPVVLPGTGTVSGIDFELEPAGSISGSVVDASGSLPYVTVCATNGLSNPTCYNGCTETALDGTYELIGVPVAADYRVEASGAGYPLECWDGYANCTDYDPVAVGNCLETSAIQFHDLAAPGPVPDGAYVPGTRMSVGKGASPGEIVIDWQPTCDADDHAIYVGDLRQFSTYTYAVCDAGSAGTYSLVPPDGDLFILVVGQSGALEGSYGYGTNLAERPDAGPVWCGNIQDLTATCVP